MEKLNEYIQADKLNEQSVETLYADLSHRFSAFKEQMAEMSAKAETSSKTEHSLKADLEEARQQQRRLVNQLSECQREVSQMSQARASALHALGLDNVTEASA
jgi:chromosome segregation ATPase